jgi:hypothetical protein
MSRHSSAHAASEVWPTRLLVTPTLASRNSSPSVPIPKCSTASSGQLNAVVDDVDVEVSVAATLSPVIADATDVNGKVLKAWVVVRMVVDVVVSDATDAEGVAKATFDDDVEMGGVDDSSVRHDESRLNCFHIADFSAPAMILSAALFENTEHSPERLKPNAMHVAVSRQALAHCCRLNFLYSLMMCSLSSRLIGIAVLKCMINLPPQRSTAVSVSAQHRTDKAACVSDTHLVSAVPSATTARCPSAHVVEDHAAL